MCLVSTGYGPRTSSSCPGATVVNFVKSRRKNKELLCSLSVRFFVCRETCNWHPKKGYLSGLR